jgi:integrase
MATITKRGKKWKAQIRIKGYPQQTQSFFTKAAAASWVLKIESQMDSHSWVDVSGTRSTHIDYLVDRLVAENTKFEIVTPVPKMGQLNQIKKYFSGVSIHDMTYDMVMDFAAMRYKTISASTLQKQMYYLRQVVEASRITTQENVVAQAIDELKRKKVIKGSVWRTRRPTPSELEALKFECGIYKGSNEKPNWLWYAIDIAVHSGLRQGEIHELKWSNVCWEKDLVRVNRKDKDSETGKSWKEVPLVEGVREALLRAQNDLGQGDYPFTVRTTASISDKFAKMTKKLGIDDLRFHDLRHEAISRMFERGMRVEQVQVVSGHSSLEQLSRYVNLRAEDLAGM